jgi:hypothetical protein
MDNHYHLLVRAREPNLSEAMPWLRVSYSCRFNWAHRQCGHVFQERYKAIVLEDQRGVEEVARCVRLNPVRVGAVRTGPGAAASFPAGLDWLPEVISEKNRLRPFFRARS